MAGGLLVCATWHISACQSQCSGVAAPLSPIKIFWLESTLSYHTLRDLTLSIHWHVFFDTFEISAQMQLLESRRVPCLAITWPRMRSLSLSLSLFLFLSVSRVFFRVVVYSGSLSLSPQNLPRFFTVLHMFWCMWYLYSGACAAKRRWTQRKTCAGCRLCLCVSSFYVYNHVLHYNARATAHCNIPQHTATHRNTLQHTATHCNTLQHTATHCNTLQHTVIHYYSLQLTGHGCHSEIHSGLRVKERQDTLQHTATHCNTLQHGVPHCNSLQLSVTHWAWSTQEFVRVHVRGKDHCAATNSYVYTHIHTYIHTFTNIHTYLIVFISPLHKLPDNALEELGVDTQALRDDEFIQTYIHTYIHSHAYIHTNWYSYLFVTSY